MLQANRSLKSMLLFNVKTPIETTCELLAAIGGHPTMESIELKNSVLGTSLEAELHRYKRAIIEMA